MRRKLLVASGNQGKIKEIKDYLNDLDFEITGLENFPDISEVIEDGKTFTENAEKKARVRAGETGLLTLADDSGLVVEYLNGAPGIYSARYAGKNASDAENNQKLLDNLKGTTVEEKKAYFKCVMVLYDPDADKKLVTKGICPGLIINKPRGSNGFGYDPIFFLPEYQKTMAELSMAEKNKISHRARALHKLKRRMVTENWN